MPFYHAIVRPDLLDESKRHAFANDVVEVHCDVTGAPPSFVHVMVTEADENSLDADRNAVINGTIRAGRTDEQKAEIAGRLSQALAATAEVDVDSVFTTTRDIQASYTMEGGALLPEPGSAEEEAWMAGPVH
ncbi:MAG: tautomerase family protein [Actinomycetota bacterium]